jgi:hypothetical protein
MARVRLVAFFLYRAQCKDFGLQLLVANPFCESVDASISSSDGFDSLPTPRHSGSYVAVGMTCRSVATSVFPNAAPSSRNKAIYLAEIAGARRDSC